MATYYPRMDARAEVVVDGEAIILPLRVRRATLESNDHLHADEVELEAAFGDIGIDPRFVRDANVAFFMGDAGGPEAGRTLPLRFTGIAHLVERSSSENGNSVLLRCQDFTSLFLTARLSGDGVPLYTDTLRDAWYRICDHTGYQTPNQKTVSTVAQLRERIVFRGGVTGSEVLAKAVPRRFAAMGGRIHVQQNADAWAVWQQCVGMLGLVTFVELDQIIVTTTVDHFEDDPDATPVLIYGSNVLECKEAAHGRNSAKGVALSSFDGLTGTTIEAYWPPPGDPRIRQQRPVAKRRNTSPARIRSEDYDWQIYPGVSDPDRLTEIARLTWEQRSRQEVEGSISTAEMRASAVGVGRPQVDLLALRSGDSIQLALDPELNTGAYARMSRAYRVEHLVERGYSRDVASLIVRTSGDKLGFGTTYKVRRVRTHLEADQDAGKFSLDIDFWNRIQLKAS